ncbi:MAG: succinate CoA transferase [Oscillospiraceae bacterium]|nr:succinate CoA transferase [Oscillospiraceae bacterium]
MEAEIRRRIRCSGLENKITDADRAARLIEDGMTVAVGGFTPSGCPKAVPAALARQVREGERTVRITLLSGASTGDEIDTALSDAGVIARRAPYITSASLRGAVNRGACAYQDVHLGEMAQNARYGYYGKLDVAVIEACAITEDGSLVPTTAVGCAQTYAALADKVLVELNLAQPAALEGFHDIFPAADPPRRRPIPLTQPGQRIGGTAIPCGADKIAAVVVTDTPDKPRPLTAPDEVSRAIASNIVRFLQNERAAGRLSADSVPLQSGVGGVANAVLEGLADSDFAHLSFYSEVMQDAVLSLLDGGKADFCSATSLSLSEPALARLLGRLDDYKGRIILRDSEISNSPEVIRRLGLIAMNTAVEADLCGNVNSSHLFGSRIYNGIGGSGDYARGAAVSVFMTPSTAKGGKISSIVPCVTHVDHTEHDVDVIVTEQGLADLRGLSPKERARLVIECCAHPDYRPPLREYFARACASCGDSQTPILLDECFSFHRKFQNTGSML